jgi:hypothetical protein
LVCGSLAFGNDAAIRKQLVGSWTPDDGELTVLKEDGFETISGVPTRYQWDVRDGMFHVWSEGNLKWETFYKIISLSKTKFVIQDMYHGRHTGIWIRSTPAPEPKKESRAAPTTDNPKMSDPNWTRTYKIEGHRTETIVNLARDGSNVNGTYRQKLLDSEEGKNFHFSGQVEEIDGRTFIKNIQFTPNDSNLVGSFWHSPEGIRWIIGEHAAAEQRHRPADDLAGDEGLILTFVSDAEAQQSGEGPTFEKILSLVRVERLQSAANNTQTAPDNERKSYIGLRYGPGGPEGQQRYFGVLEDYGVAQVKRGNVEMLWLERMTGRDASGRAIWEVLDVVLLPPMSKTDYLQGGHLVCLLNGVADPEIIAIFKGEPKNGVMDHVGQAWRANCRTGRFESISPEGITTTIGED